jgi:hypothetical protein
LEGDEWQAVISYAPLGLQEQSRPARFMKEEEGIDEAREKRM